MQQKPSFISWHGLLKCCGKYLRTGGKCMNKGDKMKRLGNYAEKLGFIIGRIMRFTLPKSISQRIDNKVEVKLKKYETEKEMFKTLGKLVDNYKEWKSKNYPQMNDEEALELYPGLPIREI